MNEVEIYSNMASAILRAQTSMEVEVRGDKIFLEGYEFPLYTAMELHSYLNGLENGKWKSSRNTDK